MWFFGALDPNRALMATTLRLALPMDLPDSLHPALRAPKNGEPPRSRRSQDAEQALDANIVLAARWGTEREAMPAVASFELRLEGLLAVKMNCQRKFETSFL